MQAYLTVSKIMKSLTEGAIRLSQWMLFVLAFIVIFDVGMRYLFNQPTAWAMEISEYILVFVAFLGVASIQSEDKHIKMDFLYQKFSSKVRLYYQALSNLLMQLFIFVVLWFSIKMTYTAYLYDSLSNSLLETPLFIPYSIVPVGMALLFLQNLVGIWGIYLKLSNNQFVKG